MGTEIKMTHSTPNFKEQSDTKTKDSTNKHGGESLET